MTEAKLERGELQQELEALSHKRFRPPGSPRTRTYSVPTLQRWYYAYRAGGLRALHPKGRSDRGRARALAASMRELLLDIRREYPRAGVPLILRTLIADGRLQEDAVSAATVRRLYAEHGLDRLSRRQAPERGPRLRWEADRPGLLWHADVCYGPSLTIEGRKAPLRIHALLDDASRYVIAIEACHTEREVDMLDLLIKALLAQPRPRLLYLDNGSTYSGETLATACGRLGIKLLHAQPYDPEARGKMERFWRTLREGCLDHLGTIASLHDVQVRLLAFLDQHYHLAAHAGLMGRSPSARWAEAPAREEDVVTEEALRDALTVRGRRRVRRDTTLPVGGVDWEIDQGWLAGRNVTVARCLFRPTEPPWVEHDGTRFDLRPVDPKANSHIRRRHRASATRTRTGVDAVDFDPNRALLDKALRRDRKEQSR
ncbi:MAG: DDE-type integrase/transposase/recombinase [Deltaproteobacteria bacterium]|nr:DDE-type integrase/transposase/recombinase [Deltaproteobacteria bacterium]